MDKLNLSVREIQRMDVPLLCDYWEQSDSDYLKAMGADKSKLPAREYLEKMLYQQIETPYSKKASYALIWLEGNQPIGHSNINKIKFGQEGFMHLHLWKSSNRKGGRGTELLLKSLAFYFDNFELQELFCEPYALNPAPNKTLEKIGFTFVKKYTTIPGYINFEQEVNQWKLSRKDFENLKR